MQRHIDYQTCQYQKLHADFDTKKRNRDFRYAFCDRKRGPNVTETDARNPVSKNTSNLEIRRQHVFVEHETIYWPRQKKVARYNSLTNPYCFATNWDHRHTIIVNAWPYVNPFKRHMNTNHVNIHVAILYPHLATWICVDNPVRHSCTRVLHHGIEVFHFMNVFLLTGFGASPRCIHTGPNANRVPQNIAGLDNT